MIPSISIKQHRIQSRFLPFHMYLFSLLQPLSSVEASHPRLMFRLWFPALGYAPPLLCLFLPQALTALQGTFPAEMTSSHSALGLFLYWASFSCMNSDTSSWIFFPCGLPPQPTLALKPHTELSPRRDRLWLPACAAQQGWCSLHSAWALILPPMYFPCVTPFLPCSGSNILPPHMKTFLILLWRWYLMSACSPSSMSTSLFWAPSWLAWGFPHSTWELTASSRLIFLHGCSPHSSHTLIPKLNHSSANVDAFLIPCVLWHLMNVSPIMLISALHCSTKPIFRTIDNLPTMTYNIHLYILQIS